jgi:hypothetical protein
MCLLKHCVSLYTLENKSFVGLTRPSLHRKLIESLKASMMRKKQMKYELYIPKVYAAHAKSSTNRFALTITSVAEHESLARKHCHSRRSCHHTLRHGHQSCQIRLQSTRAPSELRGQSLSHWQRDMSSAFFILLTATGVLTHQTSTSPSRFELHQRRDPRRCSSRSFAPENSPTSRHR